MLSIDEINLRIEQEYCQKTIDKISNTSLKTKYQKNRSTIRKMQEIKDIMEELEISNDKIEKFLEIYQDKLVGPGLKGQIRGLEFNKIIKEKILNMNLDDEKFNIKFEKKTKNCKTDEKPDWFIEEKNTSKIIIGMNQLDFWKGGHQLNRGYKYIMDNKHDSKNIKFLSVVCNKIKLHKKNTKAYHLFNIGYQKNILTYIGNLENIIYKFFDL